jgi:tRNA threonylcarbamoyladenosine biosynthesis protein TsaB
LATAKGLCYVLDKPLIMHSKLLLMVLSHYYKNLEAYEFYAAILTARDKEYYFATYNNKLEVVLEPQHVFEDDLPKIKSLINGKTLLTGNITDIINDIFQADGSHLIAENGIDINSWATYSIAQFECHEFVNLAHAEPFYLKQVFTHKSKNIN